MEYTVGTKVFDEKWEITEKLGEGASGQVFKIVKENEGISLEAALKVIRVPKSQDEVRQILNEGITQDSVTTYFMQIVEDIKKEVRTMIQLKGHPNIVSCDDFVFIPAENKVGGDILIRMELLTPLSNYVMQGSMSEGAVRQMAKELCSALDFCHKKGMIHRDIKPENIFVSPMGQFKLGDFGLARTIEKSTGGLSKKGTEGYMAPEVYLGKGYNHTVDIYSMGLVLYKSLNRNRLPFFPTSGVFSYADREEALSRRMKGDALPKPADATEAFGDIILKACAFDPANRYQSAEEMLNMLNEQTARKNADDEIKKKKGKNVREKQSKEKTVRERETDVTAWSKFKMYTMLILVAAVCLFIGYVYITGEIYSIYYMGLTKAVVYYKYGVSLKTLDIAYGSFLVLYAAFYAYNRLQKINRINIIVLNIVPVLLPLIHKFALYRIVGKNVVYAKDPGFLVACGCLVFMAVNLRQWKKIKNSSKS